MSFKLSANFWWIVLNIGSGWMSHEKGWIPHESGWTQHEKILLSHEKKNTYLMV